MVHVRGNLLHSPPRRKSYAAGGALGAVYNGEWLTSEAVNGYYGQYVYYRVTISFEILS